MTRVAQIAAALVLREFDLSVRDARIDIVATYTQAFVDKAPR